MSRRKPTDGGTRGRPTALTPDVKEAIVRAVERGNYLETAAALAGIARSTFYEWMRRGAREESGPYREFSDAVKRAIAKAEDADLALIEAAAQRQWQAAAWRLERRFPARWSQRTFQDSRSIPMSPVTDDGEEDHLYDARETRRKEDELVRVLSGGY